MSMWGESGPRPPVDHDLDPILGAMQAAAEISVACDAGAAWSLVSDIGRIGEFSPECVDAWWVDGFPAREVGGRFEGRNRVTDAHGTREWIRPCTVVAWRPEREFSWVVGDRFDGSPASRWTFRIRPDGDGIVLREEFQHVPDGITGVRLRIDRAPARAADLIAERTAQLNEGIAQTLERMRRVLEGQDRDAVRSPVR